MNQELRVLLIKEGGLWVAQGLELNIAVQGQFIDEVERKFVEAAVNTIMDMEREGIDWRKSLIGTTPPRYFEMYEKARTIGFYIDGQVAKLLGNEEPTPAEHARFLEVREDKDNQQLAAC